MANLIDPHGGVHSEQGAGHRAHTGRDRDPVVKVRDLAWLEWEQPDLDRTQAFAEDFGFAVSLRTPDELHLRGTDPGTAAVVVRRGPRTRFVAPVFQAAAAEDLTRLARACGSSVTALGGPQGGQVVRLTDPAGQPVSVVHGSVDLPQLPQQPALTWNTAGRVLRVNEMQRPPAEPARVRRLGHVVLERQSFVGNLDWYLHHLGLIVSDFLYFDGQRDRGPVMGFLRCDRGAEPADHHTLALLLGPRDAYVHSAYEVTDLDALAAGGRHLQTKGYTHAWGIGRHVQGSQVFDYWREPGGLMVEHFTDGDRFDAGLEPGWSEMSASGLAQWGPKVTREFLGTRPSPELLGYARDILSSLRADNEFDVRRLAALIRSTTR